MPVESLIPKVPTAQDILRRALPPELRAAYTGKDKRRRPRITIQELNQRGVAAVQEKWPDLPTRVKEIQRARPDERTALERVFDWIDLPRNVVANAIGSLVGVEKGKLPRGALGLRRVGMGDVLGKLGVKPGVLRSILALGLDIGVDPLTYLTAGALTGAKVAKWVPRLSKAGMNTIKGALRTGRVPTIVSQAVAGAKVAGLKPLAVAEMIAKNVTRGDDVGRAARAFFQQFGIRGRHLLRVPFTQIKTPALPIGRQAQAYRAMQVGAKGEKALSRLAGVERSMAGLKRHMEIIQRSDIPQKKKRTLINNLVKRMAGVGKRQLGFEAQAPEVLRLRRAAEMGAAYSPRAQPIRWALQQKFGFGRMSPLRQQELAAHHRATLWAAAAGRRAAASVRGVTDDFARELIGSRVATDHKEALRWIGRALDVGSPENLAKLHEADPASKAGRVLSDIMRRPGYQRVRSAYQNLADKFLATEKAKGIRVSELPDLGYFHRTLTPEAGRYAREYGRWLAPGSTEGIGGRAAQPFMKGRVRRYDIMGPGGEKETLFKTPQEIESILKQRSTPELQWKVTKEWPVSLMQHEELYRKGAYGGITGGPIPRGKVPYFFAGDPAASIGSRAFQHHRAMGAAQIQDLVMKGGAIPINDKTAQMLRPARYREIRMLHPDNPLSSIFGRATREIPSKPRLAAPWPIADMIERYDDLFRSDQAMRTLLRASDATLAWFKRWALFHPAYVIRNVFQNLFGTLMAGGPRVMLKQAKFWRSPEVRMIFKAIDADDLAQLAGKTMRIGNKTVPLELIARDFIMYNGQGSTRSVAEFAAELLRGGGQIRGFTRGVGRGGRITADVVRNWNAAVETQMRMGTWLAFMDEGLSGREAMMRTIFAMPDLSDLTKFEKNTITRIMPWARWFRKNGALQLFHYLPNQPAWMASTQKLKNFVEAASPVWRGEAGVVPEELRPRWMRERQAPQFAGGPEAGSAFLMGTWFPFEEAQAVLAFVEEPGATGRMLASQARPGIKMIFETATGQDIFRQAPVKPFTMAEAVGALPKAFFGTSGTPLDNLLAMRPLREYGVRVWQQPTVTGKISRALIGGAVQPLDAEKGLRALDYDTQQKLYELRRLIARAVENRETAEVQRLQQLLIQFMSLQRRRQEIGAQIPRASEAAMRRAGIQAQPRYATAE